MDAFRSKISAKTKLVVLNSPANPTGGVMPREDVETVAALATEHGECRVSPSLPLTTPLSPPLSPPLSLLTHLDAS
jgi:O-acetylhomoserine/O-acetylserine sulfhydrylase-like pyridoxal-dependent enzyme